MIKKIIILVLVISVLSYLGQMISGRLYAFEAQSFSHALILIKKNFLFIILSQLLFYFFDILRLFFIARALNLKLTLRDHFGAISLNILFGWLSPSAILGAPAMAYYLYKRGYPLAESITMSFVRSFFIIFVSAITTITIYGLDLQGAVTNIILQEKIFQVLIAIAIYLATLILLSVYPWAFIKRFKILDKITGQIRLFLKGGALYLLPILSISLINNFLLVCFIPYVTFHYYDQIAPLISQTLLFLSYMLLMPTPGASGLAEVGAPMFFGSAIPIPEMISTVTAMRVSTISFQVGIGLIFMFFFMKDIKDKMSFSELKKFKKDS